MPDVRQDEQVPVNKENFWCAKERMTVVCQFWKQYYKLYDSDKRGLLVNDYHNRAMFSVTSTYPPGQSSTTTSK
jgi:nuclear RNA export factor